MIAEVGYGNIRGLLLLNQWSLFDSSNYYNSPSYPEGIRFEYPLYWELATFEHGASKNLGDLRIALYHPFYIFSPRRAMNVYWTRTNGKWELEDVADWFISNNVFGIDNETVNSLRGQFETVYAGRQNYPALIATVKGEGRNTTHTFLLLLDPDGDEAFGFDFVSHDTTVIHYRTHFINRAKRS